MEIAVHYRCLEQCHKAVQALDLPGLPQGRVFRRKFPADRDLEPPFIVVSFPVGAVETYEPGTNDRDDLGYPILVTFAMASNQDLDAGPDFANFITWRERVMRRFRFQRLDGVPEIFYCRPEPQPILDADLFFDKNLDVGGILFRFISREVRG